MLLFLILVFFLLGCAIVIFFKSENRKAHKQRANSTYGLYTLQKSRVRGEQKVANINDAELQVINLLENN